MHKKLGHIAYNKTEGKQPTIVFMSGFKSDMEGTKAVYLESVAKELGHAFIRFDYSGHGISDGEFKDGTISQWRDDALKVIDELTTGELILVGSSMGGWIMLLTALARKDRIKGIVGIASAPDFTEELIWKQFNDEQKKTVMEQGQYLIPNCYDDQEPYPITRALIEDGRNNLLMGKEIKLTCPARFIHGMKDEDVPFQLSVQIAEKLNSTDVEVHIIKNADHRMSEPANLELLKQQVLSIINLA